jgi:phosphatidylserine decarboxylase
MTVVGLSFDSLMKKPSLKERILLQEDLNFLLTNRIPRNALTRWMGWFSQIESPLLTALSIWVWRRFTDLDLSEAKYPKFNSLHACFTRELKPGARPFDAKDGVMCSPCDAIVGAMGTVEQGTVVQAKGFPYSVADLMGNASLAHQHEGYTYLTLRLTSSMYHRFHAPLALRLHRLHYISGDTWNVNPIALKRIERLFCKNERAVLEGHALDGVRDVTLVPVAAILVASMRFHGANITLNQNYQGPQQLALDATVQKGDELGWFEHGSTIILFIHPRYQLYPNIQLGERIKAGQALCHALVTSDQ